MDTRWTHGESSRRGTSHEGKVHCLNYSYKQLPSWECDVFNMELNWGTDGNKIE